MEFEAERFYVKAAEQTQDVGVRRLLGDLAEAEKGHEKVAAKLTDQILSPDVRAAEEKTRRRVFVLQYVQPGLAGLMDGSVSTLAPLFAAAFATHQNWQTFLVGLAASIGAGISMGFAEALSDDGSLTGRGSPWLRGVTCGVMTTLGGLGHTMPYLVPDSWANAFWIATAIAGIVVFFELWAIAYIRARYMDTPFLQAVFQIVLGGVIVLGGRHSHRRGLSGAMRDTRIDSNAAPAPALPAGRRGLSRLLLATAGQGDRRNPGLQRRHRGARPVHHPAAPQLCRRSASRTRRFRAASISNNSVNGTPEFAYGVTDWWEVGLYLPFAIKDQQFLSDSFKLRTLFVSPHADQRNFFYGVNFEFSNTTPKFSQIEVCAGDTADHRRPQRGLRIHRQPDRGHRLRQIWRGGLCARGAAGAKARRRILSSASNIMPTSARSGTFPSLPISNTRCSR